MDWITGIQNAINYMEDHILEEIDYEEVAKQSYSSNYHFQRVFGILCGYTVGEYIRNRRLSLAGMELQTEKAKVIDVALKYGYDSPDSFAKAFQKFHGITPRGARMDGAVLNSFSRLSLKITLEGGKMMNYRIEEKPEFVLTGYKRHFTGTPAKRADQEEAFYLETRMNQYALKGLARDCETNYNVIMNMGDDGYDFYIASKLHSWVAENLESILGKKEKDRFENITIPAGQYLVCETERERYPVMQMEELRKKAVSEWLPSSGYELANAPEINVVHWFYEPDNDAVNNSRYVELWLPIVKA